ncbi:MAG: pyridoxal-phosphate dependent enzyme [Candidatus Promineifilaceae bacterium]
MIDLTTRNEAVLKRSTQRARERNIIMPTFKQMADPSLIPSAIQEQLGDVGLWDLNPLNLFRINWHNEPVEHGGKYGGVNYIELPKALTGIDTRIVLVLGHYFPTGAHKVGAAYGCLAPQLSTGQFDPTTQRAAWPSTGNYCRGGAYDSNLLGCDSIAILPEGMSKERFEWLETVAGETIKTPGSESNVKEIFDKCWELMATGQDIVIFNQFDQMGNYLWHHEITGRAMAEAVEAIRRPGDRFRGMSVNTGSAGTIAAGDYLKKVYPGSVIGASEALQCPTMLNNGFGSHRIEGIGDKHIPWVHNVKNTDLVTAIDDEAAMALTRLFNTEAGMAHLANLGVDEDTLSKLHLLGISGIANMLSCIKIAKYYEMTGQDILVTVATDSMALYQSRLEELDEEQGKFSETDAAVAYERYMLGENIQNMIELGYYDRKRIHNLKYYTWVEQQGKTYEEIQAQWYDDSYWSNIPAQAETLDQLIEEFNSRVGLL